MGGGNFAASFAAAHGGRVLTKKNAQILFAIFVFLGAIFIGQPVAQTLGNKITPPLKNSLTMNSFVESTLNEVKRLEFERRHNARRG